MPSPQAHDEHSGGRFSTISTIRDGKWSCNVCGILDNWATRRHCRNCKAYGPWGSGTGGKGGGKGGSFKGSGKGFRAAGGAGPGGAARSWGGGTSGDGTTLAARQLQRQQEDHKFQKLREESKKKEDALRAANAKLQRELAATKAGGKHLDEDEDIDVDDETNESRQEKIEATQKALPYLTLRFGENSPEVEKARCDIEELLRANRESKPYKTHRGQLERKLDRMRRQQERAKEEEDEVLREIETMQSRLNKLRATIEEREKSIGAADEELKDLLRRAIAEGEPAEQPPTADPSAAWETVNQTLADMASQPGVPPAWAAQLGGLLEQVRAAAVAIQLQAASIPQTAPPPPPTLSTSASSASPSATSPPSATSSSTTSKQAGASAISAKVDGSSSWENRAWELAFAEGGTSSGGGGNADAQRVEQAAAAGDGQGTKAGDGTATSPVSAAAAAVPGHPGGGGEPATDADESDDEMASIMGAEELDKRESESAAQHKLRLARHLKERAARKKEEKSREGKCGKQKGEKDKHANREKTQRKSK